MFIDLSCNTRIDICDFYELNSCDRMKEERLGGNASEILSWVNRSRQLEEKRNLEKEKALERSRIFEEQVSYFVISCFIDSLF